MTKEELMSYKAQTEKIRLMAETNATRIWEEHSEAYLAIRKKCNEFSEMKKELCLGTVRIETGIRYNNETIFLEVSDREVSIEHPALYFDNKRWLSSYLPEFDKDEESRVLYRFIELWDEAEMTKKYYEKCMELLEKDRGKICEKLEKTNKAADRIRVTEIYQNGELVSRNEEAL